MNVSFDEFTELLKRSDAIQETEIRVTAGPQDALREPVRISTNLVLTFDPSVDFTCRNILITECEVEIRDLSLIGTITVRNGTVRLCSCRLQNPPAGSDYILDATDHSRVTAVASFFGHTSRFGICADGHTFLNLERCSVTHVNLFGVALTGKCFCSCSDCIFTDGNHDLLFCDNSSSLCMTRCSIRRSARLGISVGLLCSLKLDEVTIENCQSGCIGASNCERVFVCHCHFLDTPHSSVLLENTIAMVKHTMITNCLGNAINASRGTKIILSHCTLKHTTYPPLALCDGTLGYVKKCTISDSQMNGIIVRNRSRAAIKKCTIENVKQAGIVVSDSRDVTVTSTFLFHCREAAISCYNHSELHLRSSFLIGPSKSGMNVFTGGFVCATDATIAGMSDCCVWLHHGGAGRFFSTLMHNVVYDSRDAIIEQIKSIPIVDYRADIPDEQLFRIETQRPVVATGSFVVGRGIVNFARNESNDDPQPGLGAVAAKCKMCGVPAVDCYFAFCGHSLFCKACWDSLEEKPRRCELCAMPIEKVTAPINCSHDEERTTCGICLSELADAIVVPCGHLICAECGSAWFEQHSECPYCREACAKSRQFVSYA
jgi:hypothetical protein